MSRAAACRVIIPQAQLLHLIVGRLQREGDQLNGGIAHSAALQHQSLDSAKSDFSQSLIDKVAIGNTQLVQPLCPQVVSQSASELIPINTFYVVKIQLSHIAASQERPIQTTNKRAALQF
ncbi:hypothetical protein BASA81_007880 [Batrachochytrium salamandrivorans]|nr:hypothetical protein BASA81_007880 [Batrachochytrium salamandrivorans]